MLELKFGDDPLAFFYHLSKFVHFISRQVQLFLQAVNQLQIQIGIETWVLLVPSL